MKLHHIGYLVKNLSKSVAAFEKLGYALRGETCFDDSRRAEICFMDNGDTPVELVSPSGDSVLFPLLKQYCNQPYHLCYEVEDLEKQIEILRKNGYLLFNPPQKAIAIGDDAAVAFLMHRSIGMIELVQINCSFM